jgi:hypothetical protein
MNDLDWLYGMVDRKSWSFKNLIGQATSLPIADGGTGVSTVADLVTTLGLSSMAFQASSTVAITGGSISTLTYLSTTALSTGTARVLTNLSSATLSTASLFAATQVSTVLALINTNVSSASVSTANVYSTGVSTSTFLIGVTTQVGNLNSSTLQGLASSYYLATVNHFLSVTTITDTNSPYTVTGTDRYIRCSCVAGPITVLFPHASSFKRELFVKKVDASVSTVTISSIATDTFDGKVTTALASQWSAKSFINPVSGLWERLNVPTI